MSDLATKKTALETQRAGVEVLQQRAVQAANAAQVQLVQLDAQIALLAELLAEEAPRE
jgi:hypothetical protein